MLYFNRLHIFMTALVGLAAPLGAQSMTGCWAGTVGSGPAQRRAALEFANQGPGWSGAIHVLSRSIDTDSITAVTVTGNAVTFAAPGKDGGPTFSATLRDEVLTGESIVGDSTFPFRFVRAGTAPDPAFRLIGYWAGWFEQSGVGVLRAGLEFVPAPCGQILVTLDSPDQGAENLPLTSFRAAGDSLLLEMLYIDGAFAGNVGPTGDSITGLWRQGGSLLDLRLARTDSAPGTSRPQDPAPPYPYLEEEIEFENRTDGVTLAGTLTLPEGEGPFPAAVMLTGSGAQNRDEALGGHRPFLVIADHLTRRGIAVLRYDDRGVGGSSGDLMATTLVQNAADALAAIRLLATHAKIAPDRIGLIGHSEGGWMAPIAAAQSDDVAFVVMLAGPAVSGGEILQTQSRAVLEADGAPADFIDGSEAVAGRMWEILRREPHDSTARVRLLALVDTVTAGLPAAQRAALDSAWSEPTAFERFQQSLSVFLTRWFRDILAYDPRAVLRRMDVPVLALYGGLDLQVPPAQSVPVLEELWAAHPDATIHVFPPLNHLFQHATTGLPAEYARIDETFAPAALDMMSAWILKRFGATGRGR